MVEEFILDNGIEIDVYPSTKNVFLILTGIGGSVKGMKISMLKLQRML